MKILTFEDDPLEEGGSLLPLGMIFSENRVTDAMRDSGLLTDTQVIGSAFLKQICRPTGVNALGVLRASIDEMQNDEEGAISTMVGVVVPTGNGKFITWVKEDITLIGNGLESSTLDDLTKIIGVAIYEKYDFKGTPEDNDAQGVLEGMMKVQGVPPKQSTREFVIEAIKEADITEDDWYCPILELIPNDYARGRIDAEVSRLTDRLSGSEEEFREELIDVIKTWLD